MKSATADVEGAKKHEIEIEAQYEKNLEAVDPVWLEYYGIKNPHHLPEWIKEDAYWHAWEWVLMQRNI